MRNQKILITQFFLNKEISSRAPKLLLFRKKNNLRNNLKFFKFYTLFNFYFFVKFFFFKILKIKKFIISPIKINNNYFKLNNLMSPVFYNYNYTTLDKINTPTFFHKNKSKNFFNLFLLFNYTTNDLLFKYQFLFIILFTFLNRFKIN
jgi:hypothetical protein